MKNKIFHASYNWALYLHIIKKDNNIRIALGPTNVKIVLEDLLEQKLS
jgi:hypothetical protein